MVTVVFLPGAGIFEVLVEDLDGAEDTEEEVNDEQDVADKAETFPFEPSEEKL